MKHATTLIIKYKLFMLMGGIMVAITALGINLNRNTHINTALKETSTSSKIEQTNKTSVKSKFVESVLPVQLILEQMKSLHSK